VDARPGSTLIRVPLGGGLASAGLRGQETKSRSPRRQPVARWRVRVRRNRHATASTPFQVTTDGFAPSRSAITTNLHDRLTGFAQLIQGLPRGQ